jgi:hypothetical protein
LANSEERKKIAVAGWKRARKDYNETALFARDLLMIQERLGQKEHLPAPQSILPFRRRETRILFFVWFTKNRIKKAKDFLKKGCRFIVRVFMRVGSKLLVKFANQMKDKNGRGD